MVQYLCKETWFCVNTRICNGSIGSGQLQVGHALCKSAQGGCRAQVILDQGGDAHVFRVLDAQLGSNGFHQGPYGHNVHGVDDAVTDIVVAHKSIPFIPPVPEGFGPDGVGSVIVHGSQGGAAGIHGRCKG